MIFLLLFTVLSLLFAGPLSHILHYHEQHHLFLFGNAYFYDYLFLGGIVSYFSDFLIQFFYYPWLGSILFAAILSSIYLLSALLCKLITEKPDILQLSLIPPLFLLISHESTEFPVTWATGLFLCLFMFLLIVSIPNRPTRAVVGILIFAALFFITGPSILLTSVLLVATICVMAKFITHRIEKIKTIYYTTLILLVLYSGTTFYFFVHSYNMRERLLIEATRCVKEKDWEGVLTISKRYKGNNQLISYYTNMALYHRGRMPYDMFKYSQSRGVESLYFPWKSDSRTSEFGHFIYEELGYLNEAHRWAFEAMVVFGETAPNLINLIRYNIANDRPLVAQRFINVLKKSLFYQEVACDFERALTDRELPRLNTLPHNIQTKARFSNVLNIGPELRYICEVDSTNKMAFEYLMSDLLLSNQVVRFAENLYRIKNFSYPSLPPIYEEALFIYKLGVDEATFKNLGFIINPSTEARFKNYYSLMKSGDLKSLKERYGGTYWYYLNFMSPYGSKIINN